MLPAVLARGSAATGRFGPRARLVLHSKVAFGVFGWACFSGFSYTAGGMSPSFHQERRVSWFPRLAVLFVLVAGVAVAVAWSAVGAEAEVIVLSEPVDMSVKTEMTVGVGEGRVQGKIVVVEETTSGTYPVVGGTTASAPVRVRGTVSIQNDYSKSQPLVEKTRVAMEDGRVFRLVKGVTVPAGGSVNVEVLADKIGEDQLLKKGDKLSIPGLNSDIRKFFVVTASDDFVARPDGTPAATGKVVTQQALDMAVAELEGKVDVVLTEKAKAEAAGLKAAGKTLVFTTLKRAVSPAVGETGESFTVTVQRKAVAVFYDQAGVDKFVAQEAVSKVAVGRVIGRVMPESVEVEVGSVDEVAKSATLVATAVALTTVSAQSPALDVSQFVGITAEAAKKYAEKIAGVASVSVEVKPFWMGSLPKDPAKIKVSVR